MPTYIPTHTYACMHACPLVQGHSRGLPSGWDRMGRKPSSCSSTPLTLESKSTSSSFPTTSHIHTQTQSHTHAHTHTHTHTQACINPHRQDGKHAILPHDLAEKRCAPNSAAQASNRTGQNCLAWLAHPFLPSACSPPPASATQAASEESRNASWHDVAERAYHPGFLSSDLSQLFFPLLFLTRRDGRHIP